MSWYADFSNETMVAIGDHVRAIGWLSSDQPYPKSGVPPAFVARLRQFVRLASQSAATLSFPAFGGFHTCELCEQVHDCQNLGVPAGPLLYIAPAMIGHYVEQHEYCPPAEFVAAVMASPLPDTVEYAAAVEEFGQLHKRWWEEFIKRRRG